MIHEELTPKVRQKMVEEFNAERSGGHPYLPKGLTPLGLEIFPTALIKHMMDGTCGTFCLAMTVDGYWKKTGTRNTKNGLITVKLPSAAIQAGVLAVTEYNTWYVRGLCCILLEEGIAECEIYRAAQAYEPRGECLSLEGMRLKVQQVYDGHRVRYHPEETKNPTALSIPVGPNCHHSIRRLRSN